MLSSSAAPRHVKHGRDSVNVILSGFRTGTYCIFQISLEVTFIVQAGRISQPSRLGLLRAEIINTQCQGLLC